MIKIRIMGHSSKKGGGKLSVIKGNRKIIALFFVVIMNGMICGFHLDTSGLYADRARWEDPRFISSDIINWLRQNALPFATHQPDDALDDLLFLKEIVGESRIVSLGEATHGTQWTH